MKKTAILLLAVLIITLFVGCGNSSETPSSTTTMSAMITTIAETTNIVSNADEINTTSEATATMSTTKATATTTTTTATTTTTTATATTTKATATTTKATATTTKATATTTKATATKKIQTLNFQSYSNLIDGVMLVKNKNNKIGMINDSGELLVDYQYNSGLISDGGYVVFDQRYVYDKTGTLVFEDKNSTIQHCGNGIVHLVESGKWKTDGYEEAKNEGTSEGELEEYYTWKYKKIYKKIDGTEIYSFFSTHNGCEAGQFNKEGYAWVDRNEAPYSPGEIVEIINLKGEVIRSFKGGFGGWGYCVVTGGNWIISKDSLVLIDDIVCYGETYYASVDKEKDLENEVFSGSWNGKSLVSLLGEENITFYFSHNGDGYPCFSLNGLSKLSMNDKFYLFNIAQNCVIAEYSQIDISESKYILVQNSSGKWGYIDRTGKEYMFYDDATSFDNGYAMVKKEGMLYVIDENFTVVSEAIEGESASNLFNNFFSVKHGNERILLKFNPQ